jgi:hypothetical protein
MDDYSAWVTQYSFNILSGLYARFDEAHRGGSTQPFAQSARSILVPVHLKPAMLGKGPVEKKPLQYSP